MSKELAKKVLRMMSGWECEQGIPVDDDRVRHGRCLEHEVYALATKEAGGSR